MGPPYILKFTVKPPSFGDSSSVLFTGADSALHLSTLTFEANGEFYSLNHTLPANEWTTVEIHATRSYTYAVTSDDGQQRWWMTDMDIWGDYMAQANMSFAAPAQLIGSAGFAGMIKDVTLTVTS